MGKTSRPVKGFNSKLVRLKVGKFVSAWLEDEKFQFQTGSIKREKVIYFRTDYDEFQFQTGSIKS